MTRVVFWIGVALLFGVWVAAARGMSAAAEYYAAYLLEFSLSVDNIFVFVIVFAELHIPAEHQRRVLAWGIAGALVFRAVMVTAGIALVQRFHWITYPFAALILFAAWRMLFAEDRERRVVESACDVCSTWIARVIPVSPVLHGHDFWRREGARVIATPLFVALAVIETTDIVFALDSVPAVLAITRNPLIVYSSNVLAMFGLRSLYFVISGALGRLRFLRQGLAVVLVFTGAKMIGSGWVDISAGLSVGIIGVVLGVTIVVSLMSGRRPEYRSVTVTVAALTDIATEVVSALKAAAETALETNKPGLARAPHDPILQGAAVLSRVRPAIRPVIAAAAGTRTAWSAGEKACIRPCGQSPTQVLAAED